MSTNYDILNLTWKDYNKYLKTIFSQLDPTKIDIICPILKGGAVLGINLIHNLEKPSIFLRISRSNSDKTNSDFTTPKLLECGNLTQITNKNVLICEDVIDSEETIKFLIKTLTPYKPKSITICTLINFSKNSSYIVGKQMRKHKWIVFPWEKKIEIPKFNGLRFIIGENCNYNCFYCHHEGCFNKYDTEINIHDYEEKIKKLHKFCLKNKIFNIAITGGEPFLYINRLRILLKYFPPTDFNLVINTNASLINKYKEEVKSWDKIEFHINLSTLNHQIHENIIQNNFFKQELDSLEFLKETKHKVCLNIICLKKYNDNQLLDLYKYAQDNSFIPRFLIFYDTTNTYNELILNEDEICKILGNKITKKHSYGLIETQGKNPAELVKCLCIDKECKKCIENTYLHLTPNLDIKYCLAKEDVVKVDFSTSLTIQKSFEKANKILKKVLK